MDEYILLVPSSIKKDIIKLVRSKYFEYNVKFMSLEEFKRKYTFDYDEKTLFYLMKEYNFNYDTALIYLNNLYYISDKLNNDKMNKLREIKDYLDSNNLLIYNNLFKSFVKDKKIFIYGYDYIDKYSLSLLDGLNYEIIYRKYNKYNIDKIYYSNYIEDEVLFVVNKIFDLIREGINISNIKLIYTSEYKEIIKRIFKLFNIKVNTLGENLYSVNSVKKVLNNLSNYEEGIDKIKNIDIKNKVISIFNKYTFVRNKDEAKDLLIEEFKKASIKKENTGIKVITLDSYISEEDYVFLMGFNKENIPILNKDNDYFSDKEKDILGFDTSINLNKYKKIEVLNKIYNIKNLIITYKLYTSSSNYTKSDLIDIEGTLIEGTNYNNSSVFNKILLCKKLDDLVKYNVYDEDIDLLYHNYNIPYMEFDNSYHKIPKEKLYSYLNNKLVLAYTSFDNYNKCKFKYYLSNILKLNIFKDDFAIIIGNICHYVLSCIDNADFEVNKYFEIGMKKEREFTKRELFFLSLIKEEMPNIVRVVKKIKDYSSFDKAMYEKKVFASFDKDIDVTFMGVIDKVLYKEEDDKTYVVVIDYKTGNVDIKMDYMDYGLSMQLPIYLYLSSKMEIKNVKVVGFYLQKLFNTSLDNKLSLEEAKEKALRLDGYSLDEENILSKFDKTYNDSKLIKSMKTSSKGFYSYAKVLSSDKIDELVGTTEDLINKTIDNILEGDFSINPKVINGVNESCKFCEYRDICYRKEKDLEYINISGDEDE